MFPILGSCNVFKEILPSTKWRQKFGTTFQLKIVEMLSTCLKEDLTNQVEIIVYTESCNPLKTQDKFNYLLREISNRDCEWLWKLFVKYKNKNIKC